MRVGINVGTDIVDRVKRVGQGVEVPPGDTPYPVSPEDTPSISKILPIFCYPGYNTHPIGGIFREFRIHSRRQGALDLRATG
eukprot:761598-Hanusia_phi.AAC.1